MLHVSCIRMHVDAETNRAKVVSRLQAEGWVSVGGAKHEKFRKPGVREPVLAPRHRTLSPGVARNIAKGVGWS